MTYKFGISQDNKEFIYRYDNLFKKECHPDWSRITIAPRENQVALMLEISRTWSGPYGILYVLKVPRCDHQAARYQSPKPCSFEELENFARTFQKYFEADGRHHIWFADVASGCQLIYDNHDLIYSYGQDEEVVAFLKKKGFEEGNPTIPSPHVHCYNQEFDEKENEIMKYFEWIEFPLQEQNNSS